MSLSNYAPGITHYLAVSAYDGASGESALSTEVVYTPSVDGVTSSLAPMRFTRLLGGNRIEFTARAGQKCQIAASSDLVQWQSLFSTIAGTTGTMTFVDPAAATLPKRFYRVILTPP